MGRFGELAGDLKHFGGMHWDLEWLSGIPRTELFPRDVKMFDQLLQAPWSGRPLPSAHIDQKEVLLDPGFYHDIM